MSNNVDALFESVGGGALPGGVAKEMGCGVAVAAGAAVTAPVGEAAGARGVGLASGGVVGMGVAVGGVSVVPGSGVWVGITAVAVAPGGGVLVAMGVQVGV